MRNQQSQQSRSMTRWFLLSFAILALGRTPTTNSFAVLPGHHRPQPASCAQRNSIGNPLQAQAKDFDPEEEVKRRLARAKEVLAKSKAKLESKEADTNSSESTTTPTEPVPFFAAKSAAKDPQRREKVIKAKDEITGLVTADGEKMAALSENEQWERRSLLEVFENEMEENEDVYSEASQQLAARDVSASIWNLRKKMKTEDYMKIFDKRNFFIGEDN